MGDEGHLSFGYVFVGVGINSSGLLLQEEVRLVVGLSQGGGVQFWGSRS